jgi:hypothetical protein
MARTFIILTLLVASCLALAGCDDSEAPVLPSRLTVESGDLQYSKRGTALPDPLVVRVRFADKSAAADYRVIFEVGTLGGQLSAATVTTNRFGLASTRLTLPDQVGTARVRAYLDADPGVYADFMATSAEFYCPEEDPTFVQEFYSDGVAINDLFLFTRKSGLFDGAGIVRVTPNPLGGVFVASALKSFDQSFFIKIVHDAAFSASGDFFLAWWYERQEAIRVKSDLTTRSFAGFESPYGSEITLTPAGILVGCDEFGPFAVGCRDTLSRFGDASYAGVDAGDHASGDAVAVDPATDDIYYLLVDQQKLMRLPMDGLAATGPPAQVADLTVDEAEGTSGMVVDKTDGSVYMLVDTDDTRAIVRVTSAGVKATEVDFLTAPETMAAPGRQNDLALDHQWRYLYTLDRLNNALIFYRIDTQQLEVLTANPADTDPEALSRLSESDERVGLIVVPKSGI